MSGYKEHMPHLHEKIDFTVEVFVVCHSRVLLRKHDKYGIWLGVGGHIELDEDPEEAAVREVKEEVGLDISLHGTRPRFAHEGKEYKELLTPEFLNRHRINGTHEHVTLNYFAASLTDNVVPSADEKSEGWKWFSREELDDPQYGIRESIAHYARAALQALSSEEK